jgi:multimeric flavodoxin WrbA
MSKVRVLGVSGSPREGRNTDALLRAALEKAEEAGAEQVVESLARFGLMYGMIVVGGVFRLLSW